MILYLAVVPGGHTVFILCFGKLYVNYSLDKIRKIPFGWWLLLLPVRGFSVSSNQLKILDF